jgi:glutathionyl-hydroquinone reductase
MIFRALKKLEDIVSMSVVEPLLLEGGWKFAVSDPITGASFVHELYTKADPRYTGRVSVPVLWDKKTSTIVSNESSEIIRMFNGAFAAFTDERTDYYPTALRSEIDAVNARVYETLNNGVYRCGLATGQAIYEQVVTEMFATLDWLEARLAKSRYLVGEIITEADRRLFPTLLRFDVVYYALFKCNLRHVYEYSALWGYARALYQMPGIAATCDIDECKLHYYGSLRMVNPSGVVPKGPKLGFTARHGVGDRACSRSPLGHQRRFKRNPRTSASPRFRTYRCVAPLGDQIG